MVVTLGDVEEGGGVLRSRLIDPGVQESKGGLSVLEADVVQERDNCSEGGGRGGGATDRSPASSLEDLVSNAESRHIYGKEVYQVSDEKDDQDGASVGWKKKVWDGSKVKKKKRLKVIMKRKEKIGGKRIVLNLLKVCHVPGVARPWRL